MLDVGGGTSSLVDHLHGSGYHMGVLDVSAAALERNRARLGPDADQIEWFLADVRTFASPHRWDAWHDRAVFHFLTDPADRAAYRETLSRTLGPAGVAVIATFGPHGPERCSGLPTVRYSPEELGREMGDAFVVEEARREAHRTPRGDVQDFVYGLFTRREAPGPC